MSGSFNLSHVMLVASSLLYTGVPLASAVSLGEGGGLNTSSKI